MSGTAPDGAVPYARVVTGYCLGWLVAANAVGLWLGVVLLWPAAGDALAPLTYGRWVPLHLNWQLYGWCALPLAGGVLAWCFDPREPQVRWHAHAAFGAWSLALLLADEPTGSLDETTGQTVFNLLKELAEREKIAVVLATHERRFAEACHRIVRVRDGRLDEIAE